MFDNSLHTYWNSVCKFLGAERTSSLQVVPKSSDDQVLAGGKGERCSDAMSDDVDSDCAVTPFNGLHMSHRIKS
jgi:hypothetical protein